MGRALHGLYQPTSAVIEGKPLLSLVDIFVQLIYFKGCPVHILTEEIETGPAASVYCRFLRVQRRHSSLAAQKKKLFAENEDDDYQNTRKRLSSESFLSHNVDRFSTEATETHSKRDSVRSKAIKL